MEHKFKIGDRVAIYYSNLEKEPKRHKGLIKEIENDVLTLSMDEDNFYNKGHMEFAHYKQCRRLIKKKRREVFIKTNELPPPEGSVRIEAMVS